MVLQLAALIENNELYSTVQNFKELSWTNFP